MIKIFMHKTTGEIALSFSPKRLHFEDDSDGDLCNQYLLIGVF